LVLLALLAACATKTPPVQNTPLKPIYTSASFRDLPGWEAADPAPALAAFRQTCRRFAASDKPAGASPALGTNADWRRVCGQLETAATDNQAAARAFIEANLQPLQISDANKGATGLFTGYYEPELSGSLQRGGDYQTPLYGRPRDLITVDLGLFGDKFGTAHIAGRVDGTALVPYYDRAAIDHGALQGEAPVLAWAADPAQAFFLEIQGSGRIMLDNGQLLRLGYAAGNGRSYTAIGKTLGAAGDLPSGDINAITIKDWLRAHPAQAPAVMESNENVVFFKVNTNQAEGPLGAANVPLVAGVSLAVDREAVPLGALLWLDTTGPDPGSSIQRLMLAADTGGAIKGAVRGDVFFGHGPEAERNASLMKGHGGYWILVPRSS
jgi:membrane-bound lytic murein transglycosylase A